MVSPLVNVPEYRGCGSTDRNDRLQFNARASNKLRHRSNNVLLSFITFLHVYVVHFNRRRQPRTGVQKQLNTFVFVCRTKHNRAEFQTDCHKADGFVDGFCISRSSSSSIANFLLKRSLLVLQGYPDQLPTASASFHDALVLCPSSLQESHLQ